MAHRGKIRFLVFWLVMLVVACGASLDGPDLLGYPGLGVAIKRYYSNNAFEKNAVCTAPRINTITEAKVVEDTDAKLVVDIRYFFIDDIKDVPFRRPGLPRTTFPECRDFASRQFTLAKTEKGLEVTSMTGEQRRPGPAS